MIFKKLNIFQNQCCVSSNEIDFKYILRKVLDSNILDELNKKNKIVET